MHDNRKFDQINCSSIKLDMIQLNQMQLNNSNFFDL